MLNPIIYSVVNMTNGFIAGEDREFQYSSIIAECEDGARYQLRDSEIPHAFENSHGFYQLRNTDTIEAVQSARIIKISNHLIAGGELNMDHWMEVMPVYGSEAYLNHKSLDDLLH